MQQRNIMISQTAAAWKWDVARLCTPEAMEQRSHRIFDSCRHDLDHPVNTPPFAMAGKWSSI
jgi:hypothetical protein